MEDIALEEESEFQKKIKRIITIVLAIGLVLLMLSFLVPSDVLNSLVSEKKLSGYELNYGNLTIEFSPEVYKNLTSHYFSNQMTELKFCLLGEISNNTYLVNSYYLPSILYKTPISVESQICNNDTIIDLHTHPLNDCVFSSQDIDTYNAMKNGRIIGMVMCNTHDFNVYVP